jgi:putative ABC transport system permease protein
LNLFAENIKQGIGSVRSHASRAVITALIIAIGIAALVGILTSIDAMKIAITRTFSRMGSQSFVIRNAEGVRRFGVANSDRPITYTEAKQFERLMEKLADVSLQINAGFTAKVSLGSTETNPNIRVLGVDDDYLKTASYDMSVGRNFTKNEITMGLPAVIVGSEIADKLLGEGRDPAYLLNQTILVSGKPYRVLGVLSKKGSSMGMSGGDRMVIMPISRAMRDVSTVTDNCVITVASTKVLDVTPLMSDAYLYMRRVKRLKPGEDDNFVMAQSSSLVKDALDNIKMVSGVGTLIAVITLLGAAVSLMNIMLVSVTERTREIGLRKALGATPKMIRNQFLVEAVVICQIGGVAGIVFGILIGNGVGAALGSGFIAPWAWIVLAVFVCVIVGLTAGLYPANRAAKLDPIEALRFE